MKNSLGQPYKLVGNYVICSERAGHKFGLRGAPRDQVRRRSRRLSIKLNNLALAWMTTATPDCCQKRQPPSSKIPSLPSLHMKHLYLISASWVLKRHRGYPVLQLHRHPLLCKDNSHRTRPPDNLIPLIQHRILQIIPDGPPTPLCYPFQLRPFRKV